QKQLMRYCDPPTNLQGIVSFCRDRRFQMALSVPSASLSGGALTTSNSAMEELLAADCMPAAAAIALDEAGADGSDLPLPVWARAVSTALRRSTSILSGWPDEYSAWNITFQDWQIMRKRATCSSPAN